MGQLVDIGNIFGWQIAIIFVSKSTKFAAPPFILVTTSRHCWKH